MLDHSRIIFKKTIIKILVLKHLSKSILKQWFNYIKINLTITQKSILKQSKHNYHNQIRYKQLTKLF